MRGSLDFILRPTAVLKVLDDLNPSVKGIALYADSSDT